MLTKNKLIDVIGQQLIDDVIWESDFIEVQIIKQKLLNEVKYSFDIDVLVANENKKQRVFIVYNSENDSFNGVCNCTHAQEKNKCLHIAAAGLEVVNFFAHELSTLQSKSYNTYKLDLLKSIYQYDDGDKLTFRVEIVEFDDAGVVFDFQVALMGQKFYKIPNIYQFINDVNSKSGLNLGKELVTEQYEIEASMLDFYRTLEVVVNKYMYSTTTIQKNKISLTEAVDILQTFVNKEIILDNQDFLIKNKIDEIILNVEGTEQEVKVNCQEIGNYEILDHKLLINYSYNKIYLLNGNELAKLELLEDLLTSELVLNEEESGEFINHILPNIYNEFTVKLGDDLNLEVVDEKLRISLYCYLDNGIIHIEPQFFYGDYDVKADNKNILIRRNSLLEQQTLKFLQDNGYVYDYIHESFVIKAEQRQFDFLTKNVFRLRQEFEVYIDEKLQKALVSGERKYLRLDINNYDLNYFAIDFDFQDISIQEIDAIVESFRSKKEYHRLDDNRYLLLNDQKVFEQLEILSNLDLSQYEENKYRIPKYKALLLGGATTAQDYQAYLQELTKEDKVTELDHQGYHLRDYQKRGVAWLKKLYDGKLGALLADEMGLGKTLQLIEFLKLVKINNVLVVMPKSLLYNWYHEFQKFEYSNKIKIVEGTPEQRLQLYEDYQSGVLLASYHVVSNDIEHLKKLHFEVVVADEAQYIKNYQAKMSKAVKQLQADFFVAMTGTPIENNLLELWSIFDFILPTYLPKVGKFKKAYAQQNGNLKEVIKPFFLRRLKDDVLKQLPKKNQVDVYCKMGDKQELIYNTYLQQYNKDLKKYLNAKNLGSKNAQILAVLTHLRQLSIDPSIVVDYDQEPAKLSVFKELISEMLMSQQKVLVFSQFTTVLKKLGHTLTEEGIDYYYLDGKTAVKQRLMDVERFNKNRVPVYLISLKAGGVGLNLTGANNVIIYDPWWNPSVENQAIDRAHRIGQKEVVNVYRLLTVDTVEEKINELQKLKKELIDDVTNVEEFMLHNLSAADLMNLFTVEEHDD